jgi:hypothetical protein
LELVDLLEKDRKGITDPVVSGYDLPAGASFDGACQAVVHILDEILNVFKGTCAAQVISLYDEEDRHEQAKMKALYIFGVFHAKISLWELCRVQPIVFVDMAKAFEHVHERA